MCNAPAAATQCSDVGPRPRGDDACRRCLWNQTTRRQDPPDAGSRVLESMAERNDVTLRRRAQLSAHRTNSTPAGPGELGTAMRPHHDDHNGSGSRSAEPLSPDVRVAHSPRSEHRRPLRKREGFRRASLARCDPSLSVHHTHLGRPSGRVSFHEAFTMGMCANSASICMQSSESL